MEENTVFVTHKSKELMLKLRSAVVWEFIKEAKIWIFLHKNREETYSLEVSTEGGNQLSEQKQLSVKAFIEKFMIDNDKSIQVKSKKVSKKHSKTELSAGKTEILA
jgi:hypothetical protein